MDGCGYSLEIIIVPLKERMTETNFLKNNYATTENIVRTIGDCKISRQNKYSIL